jgi:hypothetical protein
MEQRGKKTEIQESRGRHKKKHCIGKPHLLFFIVIVSAAFLLVLQKDSGLARTGEKTFTNIVSSLLLFGSLLITSGLVDIWLHCNMRPSSDIHPGEITNLLLGIV